MIWNMWAAKSAASLQEVVSAAATSTTKYLVYASDHDDDRAEG